MVVSDRGVPGSDSGLEGAALLSSGELAVYRSPDGARLALAFAGRVVLSDITAVAQVQGEHLSALEWPRVSWRVSESAAVARMHGRPGIPDLEVDIRLADAVLILRARLRGTGGSALRVDSLGFSGVMPRAGWKVWPPTEGPPVQLDQQIERRASQRFWRADEALMIQALRWQADSTYLVAEPGRVQIEGRWQRAALSGRGTVESALIAIAPATNPLHAQQLVAELEPSQTADIAWAWGWRSGPTWGTHAHRDWLETTAAELVAQSIQQDLSPPMLLLEGHWWTDTGWRPGPDLGSLLALTAELSPAQVGAVLPVLSDAGDPVSSPWRSEDGQLSAQVPDARRWLADEATRLQNSGLRMLKLTELEPIPDATTIRDLVDGMSRAAPQVSMVLGSPLQAPTAAGAMSSRLSGTILNAEVDAELGLPSVARPMSLESLGFALAARWHQRAEQIGGDPGPILIGGDAGEARIAVVLAAMAGGIYLLGDAPSVLTPEQWTLFFEGLTARSAGWPLTIEGGKPPLAWRSENTFALINWSDAAVQIQTESFDLEGDSWRPLFSATPSPFAPVIQLNPRDARAWVREAN